MRIPCLVLGLLMWAGTTSTQATFRLTCAPASTPATAVVGRIGSFNNENPASPALAFPATPTALTNWYCQPQ
ncbi:hypothetical protein MTX78_08670 [Hymenobacter tibetensis]|uniref:Ig-like domain-containing protein n=1 Tax=Hymenobacter tibetensis TaxID=497967 RepID=A0ABY4D3P9_9BACT|nr:hypothetical protein [Hymenobacter tibetensis]UOG76662.1 hypothetical protein MTX78_08670 [Hymenobacter tibetensis]